MALFVIRGARGTPSDRAGNLCEEHPGRGVPDGPVPALCGHRPGRRSSH